MAQNKERSGSILVVELSLGHYELFYSIKKILEPDYRVYFGIESAMLAREQGIPLEQVLFLNRGIWPNFARIHSFCRTRGIRKIWLNTVAGPRVGNLTFFLKLLGYEVFGTLHNAHKLEGSGAQRFLSNRLSGYLVLSRHIRDYCQKLAPHLRFEYIYTCFFPKPPPEVVRERQDGQLLNIAIVGQIESKRRDLDSLITTAKQFQQSGVKGVCFRMIGNSETPEGRIYRQKVEAQSVEEYFEFHRGRLDFRFMLSEVEHCDALALMFHPQTESFEHYKNTKISGAYNFALGMNKPLLIHDFLRGEEYNNFAIYYAEGGLAELLRLLVNDKSELLRVSRQMSSDERILPLRQKARVTLFLGLSS